YSGLRRVGAFQRGKRTACLTVLMFQKPCDLRRSIRCSEKFIKDRGGFRDLGFVLRSLESLASSLAALLNEVIHEANTIAVPDRQGLVFAVGIECRVRKLREIDGAGIHGDFTACMPNPQFAAAMRRRQRDHQRAEHPIRLLPIPMGKEKAVTVVHQQLVKLSRNGHALASQTGAHFRKDGLEGRGPRLSADPDFARGDLPDLPHGRINDGFVSSPVWGALCPLYERRNLCLRYRKRQRPCSLDFHLRQRNLDGSANEEIARSLHS